MTLTATPTTAPRSKSLAQIVEQFIKIYLHDQATDSRKSFIDRVLDAYVLNIRDAFKVGDRTISCDEPAYLSPLPRSTYAAPRPVASKLNKHNQTANH